MPPILSRRFFLKASLLASLALTGGQPAWANLPGVVQPPASLILYNIRSGEKLEVCYRDEEGRYEEEALEAISRIFRCHYADRQHPIDIRTLDYLNQVVESLGGNREIHIVSGYRSPEYQAFLRRQGKNVAPNSLHLHGRAIDIRIPGVSTATLRQAALKLRLGGVGYYPRRNFLHLDSGDFRTW